MASDVRDTDIEFCTAASWNATGQELGEHFKPTPTRKASTAIAHHTTTTFGKSSAVLRLYVPARAYSSWTQH